MAEGKVISFIGNDAHQFAGIRGEDGEYFEFASGVPVDRSSVPKSVLKVVDEGVEGLTFESGTEKTVENKVEKAREEQRPSEED